VGFDEVSSVYTVSPVEEHEVIPIAISIIDAGKVWLSNLTVEAVDGITSSSVDIIQLLVSTNWLPACYALKYTTCVA
jgi:hypothetical protein